MAKPTIRTNEQLFKILVAAAWIDGDFQAEEKAYLNRVAKEKGLLKNKEIQSLLIDTQPISNEKCYQWLDEYLGNKPTAEVYHNLLSEIAGLVYVDGDIAEQEAQLLTLLQDSDPSNKNLSSVFSPVLRTIRKLYRKGL